MGGKHNFAALAMAAGHNWLLGTVGCSSCGQLAFARIMLVWYEHVHNGTDPLTLTLFKLA